MSKEEFPPLGQVDFIRPQHILCLKGSSMIIKNKVLVEASVLKSGVGVLGSPVSSSVSPHYWEDWGKHRLSVLLNFLAFFPEFWDLFWLTLGFLLQYLWYSHEKAGMGNNPKALLISSVFWWHYYSVQFDNKFVVDCHPKLFSFRCID